MGATMKNKNQKSSNKSLLSEPLSHKNFFVVINYHLSFQIFKPELTANNKLQANSQSISNIKFCKQIYSKQI
jgi:hypothetical protein